MAPQRRRRRVLLGGAVMVGAVVALALVLGAEVVIAGNGVHVEEFDPHLADGPAGAPGGADMRPLRVVWLGDSTAAGVGASAPQLGVSHQVATRLGRPVELVVLAVSGARVGDVAEQQVPQLARVVDGGAVDLIIISVGANDTTHLTSSRDFRDRYRQVMDGLPRSAGVVVLGVPDVGSSTRLAQPLRAVAGARADQLGAIVRDVAAEHGAAYVNIAANTGPAFRADPDRYFAADHYHPNDAGYALWADVVAPVVRWELQRQAHPTDQIPIPQESR